MKLDDNQVKYLIKAFFSNARFAAWERIARGLIVEGEVIVAGDGNLWIGGVGNFIKKSPAEGCLGCTKLSFNVKEFLTAAFVKEKIAADIREIRNDIADIQAKESSMTQLVIL